MNKIKCLANFIEKCQCVYDVGSDHAHLAISLLKENKVQHVVNIDINQGPLLQGVNNLRQQNVLHQTTNLLNDGLIDITSKTNIKPNYVCIAGMGGKTIIKILENKDKKLGSCLYLLQANTEKEYLRKWLGKNKYKIIAEQTIFDKGQYYQIILCKKAIKQTSINSFDAYFGKQSLQIDSKMWKQYLLWTKKKIETKKLDKYSKQFALLYRKLVNYEN